ncbi:uncharacterized protein CDAR_418681 [Caerostris darwini]|uniref:Uncharacterized protein n=1 Tax=Caerostris darwini TaxID=1538125 RepID=A0AAV4MVI6_9ARAC|nr:uncharacterized protein CDAR_418681 [Caerostris darwini]
MENSIPWTDKQAVNECFIENRQKQCLKWDIPKPRLIQRRLRRGFGDFCYCTVPAIVGKCQSVEIMKCLNTQSQAASEGRLFFPDTAQKLREYCKHLMEGLDCARRIIDECVTEEDRNVYYNLTHDLVGMNVALCTPGSPLSIRFLKHVGCYKNVSDRFRVCSNQYIGNLFVVQSQSQEEQIKMTCCTVHEYSRCMRNAIDGRCEEDAQKLVQETVITALKQSFGFCKQHENVPTLNCLRSFSASKGHATGTLEEGNGSPTNKHFSAWLLVLLLGILILS